MSIQSRLCLNTFSQTNAPHLANAAPGMATSVSPLWNTNFPAMSQRTTATNGEKDATAESPTAATATLAPGADENDKDLDDSHEYENTKKNC